ncbi:methionine--tRNA ligase [Candidatus Babeliales bacterium]|nr:methionine--tRNA ligase [Candidatus Babeliales bacterium]
MSKNNFYVTTPIYYVNAAPHLGSLYSTLLADVAARYHKLMGNNVFFLTGTDEHGQKIAESAKKAGKNPKEFVDQFIPVYENMWKRYDIEYTKFIRTTDSYHVHAVQAWILKLIEQGDIYKGLYTGWYCTPCETFVTEKDQVADAKEITCPECLRPCNEISEECYYFRLSAYQDRLLEFLQNNSDFITPKERANEVIAFVKDGLKDLSISRTTVTWGIPFPGDNKHVTYVWADALNNYITAIGYGSDEKELHTWWPADLQILGKDIVRFHAIYWPAFLMASGLEMPKKLLVHGWIKVGEQKMSKSLGNAVDPKSLADHYGVDQIRYYLTAKMAITQDSQFSLQDIEQCINSELADDLGNLLNRCSTLAEKFNYIKICAPAQWSQRSLELQSESEKMKHEVLELVQQGFFHRAVQRIWEFIALTNAYFHNHEPWKHAKSNPALFQEIIAATVYSIRLVGVLLWPVMPKKMEQLLASLSYQLPLKQPMCHVFDNMAWTDEIKIHKIETLFKKYEKPMENKNDQTTQPVLVQDNCISIDDFAKVDMRVGKIIACEIVEKSDKLFKMQVDFGDFGKRQIFAGMRKFYQPEGLVNKLGVFVVNFKPRMIMGMESQGMMLSAFSDDQAFILQPENEIVLGSKIK